MTTAISASEPRAVDVRGDDPTGKTVRECYEGDALDFVLENYDLAIGNPCGIVDFSIDVVKDHRVIELETLLLPWPMMARARTHVLVYGHYLCR